MYNDRFKNVATEPDFDAVYGTSRLVGSFIDTNASSEGFREDGLAR